MLLRPAEDIVVLMNGIIVALNVQLNILIESSQSKSIKFSLDAREDSKKATEISFHPIMKLARESQEISSRNHLFQLYHHTLCHFI
jgi:hypothetical protein